jgi:hypothetical protein
VKRAVWIERFQEAFADLDAVLKNLTQPPSRHSLPHAKCLKLYDDASATIRFLLDHPPDNGAPDAPEDPPLGPPPDPAAARRRQAKRTLIRFFNLCLPTWATGRDADAIESVVDDIVEAAVLEIRRADIAARIEGKATPT